MIDLNQAEILANRLREKRDFWQGGIDWDRIFREKRDMEEIFPGLVSELKRARSELKQTRLERDLAQAKLEGAEFKIGRLESTIWILTLEI